MLFFKAVFLLVITGPPAVSKRLNKKQALSQVQKHQELRRKTNTELRRKTAVEQDRGDEPRTIPTNTAGEIPNAIHVKSKFEMCLNARSGNLRRGDLIQIHSCSGAPNEQFEMWDDHTIRVKSKPEMCLNPTPRNPFTKLIDYGNKVITSRDWVIPGMVIPVWYQGDLIQLQRCSAAANEQFEMLDDSTIRAVKSNPPLCFSAGTGGLKQRDVIHLSPCSAVSPTQQFLVPARAAGKAAAEVTPIHEALSNGLHLIKSEKYDPASITKAMVKTGLQPVAWCLIFSNKGNDEHPTRHDWGAGNDDCGLEGGKDGLIANKQGVWKIQQVAEGMYMIKSTVDDKCLIFGDYGNDRYPTRHDWGAGNDYCGFPGGRDALIGNRQGVWKIQQLVQGKYMIKSALDGKCLIFGSRGSDRYPSRHDWGDANDYCGIPGGKDGLIANKQGVWLIDLIDAEADAKKAAKKAAGEKAAAEKAAAQKAAAEKAAADKVAAEKAAAEKAAAEKAAAEKSAAENAVAEKAAAEKAAVEKAAAEEAAAEKAAAEKAAAEKAAAEKAAAEKELAQKAAAEKAAADKVAAEKAAAEKAAAQKAAVEKAAADKAAAEKAAVQKAAAEKAAAEKAVAQKAAAEKAAADKVAAEKVAAEKAVAEKAAAEKAAAEKSAAENAVAEKAAAEKAAVEKAAAEKVAAEKAAAEKAAAEKAAAEKAAAEKAAAEEAAAQKAAVEKAAAEKAAAQKAAAAEQSQEEPETPPVPPGTPEEKSVAQAALAPAEVALARWAAASPASETVGEPEDSQASPAMKTAGESAEGAEGSNKSFAHLSTAPGFTVYALALAVTAAAEIAGAR